MKQLTVLSLGLLALLSLPSSGFSETALQPQELIKQVGVEQKLGNQIPLDLEFTNELGKTVYLSEYFGKKPIILTPVYYECPMLCTLVLNGLLDALQEMKFSVGDEFDIITYSIDPGENPSLAYDKKQAYLQKYGRESAATGWHFLTGSKESVEALSGAIGFNSMYDERSDEYAHSASIQVLTPDGKIANYFSDVLFSSRDLRLGLVEASNKKIATAIDQFMLLCYHYDPTSGKYNLVVDNLLRIFGGITTLLLLGFIGLSLKNDKNRSTKSIQQAKSVETH